MPMSVPGTCNAAGPIARPHRLRAVRFSSALRNRLRGFTLIEILVAITIVAIAASIAVVAFGTDERGTAVREARRLAGAIEHAAALAQWRNETLGISAEGGGWRFWRRTPEAQWMILTDDDLLRARALPSPLTVGALAYAGQALPPETIVPLRPSGRNEPFTFALVSPDWQIVLAADPLNRVAVAEPVRAGESP